MSPAAYRDGGHLNLVINYLSDKSTSGRDKMSLENVPYSIIATAKICHNDVDRRKRYTNYFSKKDSMDFKDGYVYKNNNSIIKKLLEVDFDAILTTNYTYEIENELCNNYSNKSIAEKRKCAFWHIRQDEKNKIHKFNRFLYNGEIEKNIWHIHGETRNVSTIVLTHDEYSRMINYMVSYFRDCANKYQRFGQCVKMKSWIDYFVTGDVYVLGFGFDFSEIDMWWLLNRRCREKAEIGNVYFFEQRENLSENKEYIMKRFGVVVDTLEDKLYNGDYISFYNDAIEKIKNIQKTNKNK